MLGSTHFIAGASAGKLSKNPILAVVSGFFLHFIMDMVPHWDMGYLFSHNWTGYLIAVSDPIIGVSLFILLGIYLRFDKKMWILTLLGGLAGLVPDVSSVIIKTFRIEWLRWFLELHTMAHTLRPFHGDVFAWSSITFTTRQLIVGLAVQVPFVLASLFMLIRVKSKKKIK